ncbi:cytokine-like protein 1 [Pimephales promelas]|uniref:cytokine-like protein 1 n=1 Tax=Pimephales promelas TaxID=90988 RepID=UPI001955878B|nr:cytokine-like protein 1 [Pimephales promelas]KAG1934629.1 cytokine-like protein [Pimephales promelas]
MNAQTRLVSLVFTLGLICFTRSAPPTCYSRMLELSKEIMNTLDKIHKSNRTKTCAELLPKMFLDVHNSCIRTKLRDFLYVTENLPESCREKPRIRFVKRRVQILYAIISRACHRDLVFFTDDCESLETGNISPRYTEDRLQQLIEDD